MPLLETLTVSLGTAVAKTTLKLWLKDKELARETGIGLFDAIAKVIPDVLAQRRTQRQFEQVAEEIAQNLMPLFEQDPIPENEQTAAILAVSTMFDKAKLDNDVILARDLEPLPLERYLRTSVGDQSRDLNSSARELHSKLLRECCNYVVEISTTLPDFQLKATREILKREREIIDLTKRVLDALPQVSLARNADEDIVFYDQYRREVTRKLDRLEIFGVRVAEANKRYALSVAYITLTVAASANEEIPAKPQELITKAVAPSDLANSGAKVPKLKKGDPVYVRVDEALVKKRQLLVRGEAGSGKTTLLQWLAVRSARRDFEGPLSAWNDTVPFFIQLRRYVNRTFPLPEELPREIAANLLGAMPSGWVHRQLETGRALVLVDGVDELPDALRKKAREWLLDMRNTFEKAIYIVTSRPPAVGNSWLKREGFSNLELQPMLPDDIYSFIDHWHEAASGDLVSRQERDELQGFREKLKAAVRELRPVRALATSPLLCAMLCALNRERRTQLPNGRLELYRTALETLLDRRDIEREIPLEPQLYLPHREKEALLQDLAYWLLQNNRSDAETSEAEGRIARKLVSMPQIKCGPSELFQHLLLRSGLLREPIVGHVDFIHKTFQEYLAAKEAVEEDDIGLLIEKSDLDDWREVVILSAGLGQKKQREQLLKGLLDRGNKEPSHRHWLHLLAVACLETSVELPESLYSEITKHLRNLVPPRNKSEASALASAGDLAAPLLKRHAGETVDIVTACIRTLGLIGTETALEALRAFSSDDRATVVRELVRCWSLFDPQAYARTVMSHSPLESGTLALRDPSIVQAAAEMKNVRELHCTFERKLSHLKVVSGIRKLTALNASNCRNLRDLSPLAESRQLKRLELKNCRSLADLSPLGSLGNLSLLDLSGSKKITDISALSSLKDLAFLDLDDCSEIRDLSPLADCKSLQQLSAASCVNLSNVRALHGHLALRYLNLDDCLGLKTLEGLKGLTNVSRLSLRNTQIADLSPIADCVGLENLVLWGCKNVTDVGPLQRLTKLNYLDLDETSMESIRSLGSLIRLTTLHANDCAGLVELPDFSAMRHLEALFLRRSRNVNLKHFSSLATSRLSILDLSGGAQIREIDWRMDKLRVLRLGYSSSLEDIGGVSGFPFLESLELTRCTSLRSIQPLTKIGTLKDVSLHGCELVTDWPVLLKLRGIAITLEKNNVVNSAFIEELKRHNKVQVVRRVLSTPSQTPIVA